MKTQEFDTPGSRFRRNVVWFVFHTNDRRVILVRIACLIIGSTLAILILLNGHSCADLGGSVERARHSPTR
jgi:hypothetical protein